MVMVADAPGHTGADAPGAGSPPPSYRSDPLEKFLDWPKIMVNTPPQELLRDVASSRAEADTRPLAAYCKKMTIVITVFREGLTLC